MSDQAPNSSAEHYASLDAAWKAYKELGDQEARTYIITSYSPLVDRIARKAYRKKPWIFDLSDLKQAGSLGLIDAVEKFDPGRNILFSTFAPRRILGSIYDEINAMDWTPRSMREKIRAVLRATEEHYANNQHAPSSEELAVLSGLTLENVKKAQSLAPKTYITAVDNAAVAEYETTQNGEGRRVNFLGSSRHENSDVEKVVHDSTRKELIHTVLQEVCTPDELAVIIQHYYEENNLKHTGVILGFSASKVSHLRKSALLKLADVIELEDWKTD